MDRSMPSLRVACVGAGYFSQFHYDSWARIASVVPVGACDLELTRAQATGLPAFDDLARMLRAVQPDVLDVILPPVVQADAIRTALVAGIRTIICQKPFGRDLAEAEILTAQAEAAGAQLIIHENFRFQPWYRRIKAALEDGDIGVPQQATFRLRPGDGQGERAYLDRQPYFQKMPRFLIHETGVHFVDLCRYLMGEPIAVYADLRRVNPVISGEDAGFVLFDTAGGGRVVFDGNRTLDHAAENLRCTMGEALIEGDAGSLRLGGDGAVHRRRFGAVREEMILPPSRAAQFGGDCVHALQQHVIEGLLSASEIENPAVDYLQVLRIEQAIYASAEAGCKIVPAP